MAVMGIDPYGPLPQPPAYAFVRPPEEPPPAGSSEDARPPEDRRAEDARGTANSAPLAEEQGRSVDTYV